MSLKANFELLVHLHEFINVDLPNQGFFRIRLRIYQRCKTHNIDATPYQVMLESEDRPERRINVFEPACHDLNEFYSQTRSVKYLDERVNMDELVRFRLQLQSFPILNSSDVCLELQLLFSPEYIHRARSPSSQGQIPSGQNQRVKIMQAVCTQTYRLHNLQSGFISFYEAEFGNEHAAKISFTVFECLSNFVFGKYTPPQHKELITQTEDGQFIDSMVQKSINSGRQEQTQRIKVVSFEQMLVWAHKHYGRTPTDFYDNYVKKLRSNFHLIQECLREKMSEPREINLKVPEKYLKLTVSSEGSSTETAWDNFRAYIADYHPADVTAIQIQKQLNQIHIDIYQFLMEVEKLLACGKLQLSTMREEFERHIQQMYAQRVFKSIVLGSNHKENKIARKMPRGEKFGKDHYKPRTYPISDIEFENNRQLMEYVLYEVTYPNKIKPEPKFIKSNTKQDVEQFLQHTEHTQEHKQNLQKHEEQSLQKQEKQKQQKQRQQKEWKQEEQKYQEKQEEQDADSQNKQSIKIHNQVNENNKEGSKKLQCSSNLSETEDPSIIADQDLTEQFESHIDNMHPFPVQHDDKYELPEIQYDESNMLIVMCHGFQGSSYDMNIINRNLKEVYPEASFLAAKSNEEDSEGDIEGMGKKLALEVFAYIQNYMDQDKVIINLVGHSMGGIIARSCIKHLNTKFQDRFGFFCSLSTPHLGYLNGVANTTKAGLWIIRQFKPILSLLQLSMKDHKNCRQTFLYRLSKEGSLKRFRKIILWSSLEDRYVAYHSARISQHSTRKSESADAEREMVENLIGNRPVHRIDVNFNIKAMDINRIIGRTAHINLITEQRLFKIINRCLPDLFDITQP